MYDKLYRNACIKCYNKLDDYSIKGDIKKNLISDIFNIHINSVYNWIKEKNNNNENNNNENNKYTNSKITIIIENYIIKLFNENIKKKKDIKKTINKIFNISLSSNEGNTPYLNVGWHPDLFILGCNINTRGKHICLILLLGLLKAVDVYINDTIYPYISTNVRNNNVKHIKEFSKNEHRLLTNGSYVMSSVKYTLLIMVSISQIDISLIKVLFGEITCLFTTDIQLSEKTYGQEYELIPIIGPNEVELTDKL